MVDQEPESRPPRRALAPGAGGDPATAEGEDTQILPRTRRGGSVNRSGFDDDEQYDGADEPRTTHRTRLALVVAGVAAVVVLGLAIGYSVLNLGSTSPAAPRAPGPTMAASAGSATPTVNADVLLSDAAMLSAAQAKQVATDRTWKVALTQRGTDDSSPQPACLDSSAAAGQPPAQQSVLRLLSASGKQPPGILHRADGYATPEEATVAFDLAAEQLGDCMMTGGYLESGARVSGVGDEAAGVVVAVVTGSSTQRHTVVLSRTGRLVNVVDVAAAAAARAVPLAGVAKALAGVTGVQCRPAGGRCAGAVAVKPGPPPLGADQPGFLSTGDLPPVGSPATTWAGTVPAPPDADFTGSGCETVSWARVPATRRTSRTYLLQDQSPTFGLDDIVITSKKPAEAAALAQRVRKDLDTCAKRKLTAKVSKPAPVSGVGAGGARIEGWTAVVSQRTTAGTARYRVGVVSVGAKTVFTFLNPQPKLDLSDDQWDTVAVRAAQRASQLS